MEGVRFADVLNSMNNVDSKFEIEEDIIFGDHSKEVQQAKIPSGTMSKHV